MKTASCILCGSSDLKNSHHIEFENKKYLYDFCNDCNFTFQNPWPSIEIESIYNDEKYWNSSNVYNNKNEEKHNIFNPKRLPKPTKNQSKNLCFFD